MGNFVQTEVQLGMFTSISSFVLIIAIIRISRATHSSKQSGRQHAGQAAGACQPAASSTSRGIQSARTAMASFVERPIRLGARGRRSTAHHWRISIGQKNGHTPSQRADRNLPAQRQHAGR
jgi:hypothetical protein